MHYVMVQEDYEIIEDTSEIEFADGSLFVLVMVDRYEEKSVGSSRDEEYYERTDLGGDVIEVECPVTHVYKNSNPNDGYTGTDASDFLNNNSWDSKEVVDVETMELEKDGEKWIASFSADPLEEYRY